MYILLSEVRFFYQITVFMYRARLVLAIFVIVLILLVQGLQSLGDWLVRRLSHR